MNRLFYEVFFVEILYFIRLKNRRKTKQKIRNRNKNKNLKPKTGHPNKFTKKKKSNKVFEVCEPRANDPWGFLVLVLILMCIIEICYKSRIQRFKKLRSPSRVHWSMDEIVIDSIHYFAIFGLCWKEVIWGWRVESVFHSKQMPHGINRQLLIIHNLTTVCMFQFSLRTFPTVPTVRTWKIRLTIKGSSSWWSFHLFLWP